MDIQNTGFYMTWAGKSDIGHKKNNKQVCWRISCLLSNASILYLLNIQDFMPQTFQSQKWNWMQNLINVHWKSTNNNSVRGQTFDLLLLSQTHTFRKQMQLPFSKIMRNVSWLSFWKQWKDFALKLAMQRVCCILLTNVTNVS